MTMVVGACFEMFLEGTSLSSWNFFKRLTCRMGWIFNFDGSCSWSATFPIRLMMGRGLYISLPNPYVLYKGTETSLVATSPSLSLLETLGVAFGINPILHFISSFIQARGCDIYLFLPFLCKLEGSRVISIIWSDQGIGSQWLLSYDYFKGTLAS